MSSDRRSHRRLWQRCRRTVDALSLPDPFDVAEFVRALAARRGRPIEMVPVTARPNLPCGLLLTTAGADYILYSADTTPLHQQHILLHEAAHLVCGHDTAAPVGGSGTDALLPHLPDALVHRVLGRTVYTEPQEREAELLASLIRSRAARDERAPALAEGEQRRLGSVFGRQSGQGGPRA